MTEVQLIPLESSDREQFIKDNQEAFNYGALEEFGQRDDHFEEDGEIISSSFFALGIISAALIWILFIKQICMPCCGIKDKGGWRNLAWFLLFGAVTMLFASPQLFLFTFKQSSAGGFVKFHLNWCNESDSWLWFYIKNMGLIFILMLPAFLAAKKEHKLFFASVLPIWLICEFVVFQPNNYDNNKLLFVWFAFTCGLTADLIIRAWARLRRADAVPEEIGQENKKAPLGRRLACDLVLATSIGTPLLSHTMPAVCRA